MKLVKKSDQPYTRSPGKPVKSKDGNLSSAQKELMEVDPEAEVSVGKYKGKSVAWIQKNDSSYWSWMVKEDMPYKWNLCVMKDNAIVDTQVLRKGQLLASDGYIWIGLKEVPVVNNESSKSEWL